MQRAVGHLLPGPVTAQVGLLEGAGTSPEKLAAKSELSQFWRVLSGCVALSGTADGRRIDLLGCRLAEAPREGAALLRELWNLTTVPFASADDALGGYMLCTFMEEPTTKQLSLISSTIPAIDLYFSRPALLAVPPPGAPVPPALAAVAVPPAAPLPPGPVPPGALVPVGTAPPLQAPAPVAAAPAPVAAYPGAVPAAAAVPVAAAALAVAAVPVAAIAALPHAAPQAPGPVPGAAPQLALAPPAMLPTAVAAAPPPVAPAAAPLPVAAAAPPPPVAAAPPPPAAPGGDIFMRFSMALAQRGLTADAAFAAGDLDKNGVLSNPEVTALMRAYVPDASAVDVKHFQAMLDTEKEVRTGAARGQGQVCASREGRDSWAVVGGQRKDGWVLPAVGSLSSGAAAVFPLRDLAAWDVASSAPQDGMLSRSEFTVGLPDNVRIQASGWANERAAF
jgi:hypothetical protein